MKKLIMAAMLFFAFTPVSSAKDFELIEEFPEVRCMALNIYYEARGSNLADRASVADVVLNRVNDIRYPDQQFRHREKHFVTRIAVFC